MSVSLAVKFIINCNVPELHTICTQCLTLSLNCYIHLSQCEFIPEIYDEDLFQLVLFLTPQSPPKGATIPYRPSPSPAALLIAGNQVRDFTACWVAYK